MRTLPELFARISEAHAARPAVVTGTQVLSFAELQERVIALAGDLQRRGIHAGHRVGILLRNSPEFIVAYWAALTAGAVAVPLNDRSQHNEIRYGVEECGLELLLTDESFRALCEGVLRDARHRCALLLVDGCDTRPRASAAAFPDVDPDAPVMLQFSSGSTGRPKRIGRSHTQLLRELEALTRALSLSPADRFLGAAPFSHVNGLVRTMLASLRAGAAVYPIAHFERQAVADLIERERISVFIAVPVLFIALAQSRFARLPDFSSLRLCISGSAPLPSKFNREFHARFGSYIRQLYGSTETGTMSVNLSTDVASSLDSVGAPLPGVSFVVVDESGRPAGADVVGEVLVESPWAIRAYEGQPELDAQAFRDGRFCTGDLGRIDHDGRLTLHGRLKFLINKGGFKIDPREVEDVLGEHPAVEEVAVVGVTTSYGDDKVKAVVVRRGSCSETDLVEFCRGKIADFKVPSIFEFRAELPKGPTGKLRRAQLDA